MVKQTAGRDTLNNFAPKFAELNDDVLFGDVVTIPAEVKHWHGAQKDCWFSHIAIECPGEETSNEWRARHGRGIRRAGRRLCTKPVNLGAAAHIFCIPPLVLPPTIVV